MIHLDVFPIQFPAYYSPESSARSKRQTNPGNEAEKEASFWNKQAQLRLEEHLTRELNFNVAKNVILFLGDGMSIPTLSAARAYMGKLEGSLSGGEESHLFFDDFPHTGLSKVIYNNYCNAYNISVIVHPTTVNRKVLLEVPVGVD